MKHQSLASALQQNPLSKSILLILEQLQRKEQLGNLQTIELLTNKQETKEPLLQTINTLITELEQEHQQTKNNIIQALTELLRKKYRIPKKTFIKKNIQNITIPTSIFNKQTGSLEALVHHLHKEEQLPFNIIATILQRNQRTIWTANNKAKNKSRTTPLGQEELFLPLTIFSDRRLTVFESATVYLKDKGYSYKKIADVLRKDQRNVWSTYARAKIKLLGEKT